jgi:hypothetical protein
MDPTYPLSVTLFWLVYTPVLVVAAVFFVWTLYRYLRSRRPAGEAAARDEHVPSGDITAELIALQAQFIVAPKLARQEAIALLTLRGVVEAAGEAGRQPDDFASLLERLSRTRPSVPTRPR